MPDRQTLATHFLNANGWRNGTVTLLAGDASNRKYFRVRDVDGHPNAVLMDAPEDRGEDVRPFIDIAKALIAQDLSAPQIYAQDIANGFLLLEDLGDDLFSTICARDGSQEPTLYPIGKRVRVHQNLQAAGRLPTKEVLTLETRMAGKDEAEVLTLEPGAMVHVYEGISRADDQPVALARTIFPAARFPQLPEGLRRYNSVTKALQESGLDDYTRAWTRLTAKRASATQAGLLQISEGAPLLRTVSLSLDEAGVPVEYGHTWFAGDRVTLTTGDAWG